jgi:hypothetical protein
MHRPHKYNPRQPVLRIERINPGRLIFSDGRCLLGSPVFRKKGNTTGMIWMDRHRRIPTRSPLPAKNIILI